MADRFVARSQLLYLVVIAAGIVVAAAFSVLAIEFKYPESQMTGYRTRCGGLSRRSRLSATAISCRYTPVGRIVGMLLMVVGIGVMAALISQVSATIVESRLAKPRDPRGGVPGEDVARLQTMVARVGDLTDVELAALLRGIVELQCRSQRSGQG